MAVWFDWDTHSTTKRLEPGELDTDKRMSLSPTAAAVVQPYLIVRDRIRREEIIDQQCGNSHGAFRRPSEDNDSTASKLKRALKDEDPKCIDIVETLKNNDRKQRLSIDNVSKEDIMEILNLRSEYVSLVEVTKMTKVSAHNVRRIDKDPRYDNKRKLTTGSIFISENKVCIITDYANRMTTTEVATKYSIRQCFATGLYQLFRDEIKVRNREDLRDTKSKGFKEIFKAKIPLIPKERLLKMTTNDILLHCGGEESDNSFRRSLNRWLSANNIDHEKRNKVDCNFFHGYFDKHYEAIKSLINNGMSKLAIVKWMSPDLLSDKGGEKGSNFNSLYNSFTRWCNKSRL